MKNLSFIVFIFLLYQNVNAQAENTPTKHNIGVFASNGSGRGLSYRYWPTKLGFQITTLPVFQKNQGHNINIGANLLYTLQEQKYMNLYAFLGNEFISEREKYNFYDQWGNSIYVDETYNTYNMNVGLGIKINIFEVLDISTQAGYGVFNINKFTNTNFSAGIGLYYHL